MIQVKSRLAWLLLALLACGQHSGAQQSSTTTTRQNPASATISRQNTFELEKQNAEHVAASADQIRGVLATGSRPAGGIEASSGERGDRERAAGRRSRPYRPGYLRPASGRRNVSIDRDATVAALRISVAKHQSRLRAGQTGRPGSEGTCPQVGANRIAGRCGSDEAQGRTSAGLTANGEL